MISFFKQLFGRHPNDNKSKNSSSTAVDITVMLIGLDNAGKTTILSALQGEFDHHTTPTVGFNRETVKHGKYNITYFDLGGGANIRKIWRKYYAAIHAAIFVIDSAEESRLEEVRRVLFETVQNPFFRGKSLLVLANKQDLKTALTPGELAERLQLADLTDYVYRYNILPCCALTGGGAKGGSSKRGSIDPQIKKGLSWLSDSIDENFDALCSRIEKEAKAEEERERKEREEKMQRVRERKEREAQEQLEEQRRMAAQQQTTTTTTNNESQSGLSVTT